MLAENIADASPANSAYGILLHKFWDLDIHSHIH